MTPLNPTDRLTVELEAQQWNQVLTFIADGPYRIAAPLMQVIQVQLQKPRDDEHQVTNFPREAS